MDFPVAVTSSDDDGLRAGFQWCANLLDEGDHVTVWTHLKGNLHNNPVLEAFVGRYGNVDHVTARGGAYMGHPGPALMAWADANDIAEFLGANERYVKGLCVVSWDEDKLRAWVRASEPEILGDSSIWEGDEDRKGLDPVVVEAMKQLTAVINHNNTIRGGYEKDEVVGALLALRDAGYELDGPALAAWATINGWRHDNPAQLEKFVDQINRGGRPRTRRGNRPSYMALPR